MVRRREKKKGGREGGRLGGSPTVQGLGRGSARLFLGSKLAGTRYYTLLQWAQATMLPHG